MRRIFSIPDCVWSALRLSVQQLMLVLLFGGFSYASKTFGQNILNKPISLHVQEVELKKVLELIEKQVKVRFVYSSSTIDVNQKVTYSSTDKKLETVLTELLKPISISFVASDNHILLKTKKSEPLTGQKTEPVDEFRTADRVISGKVTDEHGSELPGVSIVVKGTQRGTVSDANGRYELTISDANTVLVFSFVGYLSQEIEVGNRAALDVSLQNDTKALEEVVVVGYGTVKKSDLTGSVAEINTNAIKDLPVASVDQKLVGQVAGVQIQQVSGAPGAGTSVKIRGSGSLGAGNEPLYVIDGMPYSSGLDQNVNPLSFINPNDIQNITILKDASSTAIYGSRGANGVIMITTRNADKGKSEIAYSTFVGFQSVPQRGRPQMLNAREFAEYQRDRIDYSIRANEKREPVLADYPVAYQDLDRLNNASTNWYDLILQNGFMQDHNVSIQKATGDSRMLLTVGYFSQEGVIKHTGLKRYTANWGYNVKLGKRIRFNASIKPTFIDQNRTVTGTGRDADVTGIALWANPTVSPYDDQGNLKPFLTTPTSKYNSTWSFPNPLFILQESNRNYKEFRNLGSAYLDVDILDNLTFRTSFSTIFSVSKYAQYLPTTIGSPNNAPTTGRGAASLSNGYAFDWLNENTLNYSRSFGKHSLNALLGYTLQHARSNGINLNAGPYSNDLIQTINAAQSINAWGESVNEWSMISYLGRLNYSFGGRYLFTTTLRSDGSSRFGENNRFALFPSVAFAWNVTEENFMKQLPFVDQLKFRTSYGKSGNNNIGNYSHLSTVSLGQYTFNNAVTSAATVSLFNPFLGWEESEQVDVGLELALFKGRLSLVADYYNRKTVNMLLNDIIPSITGFNSQLVNKGSVRNRGIELGLGVTPFTGAFNWDLNFNIAFNRNKILSTNDNGDRILAGSMDGRPTNVSIVGQPIGQFFGFVLDGVYTAEEIANPNVPKFSSADVGSPKYRDLNGDGIISEILDYTALGSPHPNFIFGLSNRLGYKNFDLAVNLNGQSGGYVMNGMRQSTDNLQGFFNIGKEWVNRYRSATHPGDGIHAAGPNGVHRVNDKLWLEDASYLRITNLTVGYTLPPFNDSGLKIFSRLRVYLSAQNLATFTNYTGANPEGQAANVNITLAPGYDMSTYPIARSITAGLNVTF